MNNSAPDGVPTIFGMRGDLVRPVGAARDDAKEEPAPNADPESSFEDEKWYPSGFIKDQHQRQGAFRYGPRQRKVFNFMEPEEVDAFNALIALADKNPPEIVVLAENAAPFDSGPPARWMSLVTFCRVEYRKILKQSSK